MKRHIVIVGNGIAGVTAARFIRKNDAEALITIVSAETRHHFSRTALMYVYMGHMTELDLKPYEDRFWPENRLELRQDWAVRADFDAHILHLASGHVLSWDVLILATGARSNRLGWLGETLSGIQGLVSIQDLRSMIDATTKSRGTVVVGGGLIGIEMVEMLRSRHIPVSFLIREKAYMDYLLSPSESRRIHEEIEAHGVQLMTGTEVHSFAGDASGRVEGVQTSNGDILPCDWAGLAVGVHPNTDLATASGLETEKGILVDRSFRTSAPDVFAIGDCAQFREPLSDGRRIEQLWYSGRQHGRELGLMLCGRRAVYSEPIFYNSAKFFDLEYQTYGRISSAESREIQWESRGRSVRVSLDEDSGNIKGINAFGVRIRHEVISRMIRAGTLAQDFVHRWNEVCFDREFSRSMAPPSDILSREVAA